MFSFLGYSPFGTFLIPNGSRRLRSPSHRADRADLISRSPVRDAQMGYLKNHGSHRSSTRKDCCVFKMTRPESQLRTIGQTNGSEEEQHEQAANHGRSIKHIHPRTAKERKSGRVRASGTTNSRRGRDPICNLQLARYPATVISVTVGGSQREHSVRSGCVIHKERGFRIDVVLFVLVQRVGRPGTFRPILIRSKPCESLLQFGIAAEIPAC